MDSTGRVVLTLVLDVVENPRQILAAEADHAVAALPFHGLAPQTPVDFVSRGALQFLDQIADCHERLDLDGQVHMRVRTAKCMQAYALYPARLLAQHCMRQLLDLSAQRWIITLRVPVEVQEHLVKDVATHESDPAPVEKPG